MNHKGTIEIETEQEYKNNSMYQDFQIKITKDVLDKEKELWTL